MPLANDIYYIYENKNHINSLHPDAAGIVQNQRGGFQYLPR